MTNWGLDSETQQTSTGGELGKVCMMMIERCVPFHNAINIPVRRECVNEAVENVEFMILPGKQKSGIRYSGNQVNRD